LDWDTLRLILITSLAFSVLDDGLHDVSDPKLQV
jgi:ABC-type dipeptide/oligopeptide/nickel transport system permease subunit